MKKVAISFACAVLLAGSAAQASTLAKMSGVVRVNQEGSGYQTVSGPGPLNSGDLVLVSPGGLAQVSYSCGLTETVAPDAVYTVGDDARKCAQANVAYKYKNAKPMYFHVPGAPLQGHPFLTAAGLAALGGLVGCLVNWCQDDDKSSSP